MGSDWPKVTVAEAFEFVSDKVPAISVNLEEI